MARWRYAPEPASRIGDLFVLRGYAVLLLAEHFCSGVANVVVEDGEPVDGPSRTTDELLGLALAAFDTAAALADSDASVASRAALGKGRTLLNLGLFAGRSRCRCHGFDWIRARGQLFQHDRHKYRIRPLPLAYSRRSRRREWAAVRIGR